MPEEVTIQSARTGKKYIFTFERAPGPQDLKFADQEIEKMERAAKPKAPAKQYGPVQAPKPQGDFLTSALKRMSSKLPPGHANPYVRAKRESTIPVAPTQDPRKAVNGMEFANLVNEIGAGLTKKLAPLDVLPGPISDFKRATVLRTRGIPIPKTSELASGAIMTPLDAGADLVVFSDTKSTPEQQARALTNFALKSGIVPAGWVATKLAKPVFNKAVQLLKRGKVQDAAKLIQNSPAPPEFDLSAPQAPLTKTSSPPKAVETPKVGGEATMADLEAAGAEAVRREAAQAPLDEIMNNSASVLGPKVTELYKKPYLTSSEKQAIIKAVREGKAKRTANFRGFVESTGLNWDELVRRDAQGVAPEGSQYAIVYDYGTTATGERSWKLGAKGRYFTSRDAANAAYQKAEANWEAQIAAGERHADYRGQFGQRARVLTIRPGENALEAAKREGVNLSTLGGAERVPSTTPPTTPKAVETPKVGKEPESIVYRTEEPGVTVQSPSSKPHGLYLEVKRGELTDDIADLRGGTVTPYRWHPKNPLDVSDIQEGVVFRRGGGASKKLPVELSAGIKAARRLLGEEEFARLNSLEPTELRAHLKQRYPDVEWNRYYDDYERMEAVGAIEARKGGYDALIDPQERVALTDSAISPTTPPTTPKAETPKVGKGTNQSNAENKVGDSGNAAPRTQPSGGVDESSAVLVDTSAPWAKPKAEWVGDGANAQRRELEAARMRVESARANAASAGQEPIRTRYGIASKAARRFNEAQSNAAARANQSLSVAADQAGDLAHKIRLAEGTAKPRTPADHAWLKSLPDRVRAQSVIHKDYVESALKEGKPVPPEVLADYPDLAAKYGTKPPTTPPTTPKGGETGGINRADRVKDAEELGTNKPVTIGGKSHAELEAQGQKAVAEGFDFEDELAELARGARPATDEQVGIFKAGRDSLKAELKKLNTRLDKGDTAAIADRDALLERIADFDRNLDEVKGAGGRSLSALRIGQTVNFSDLDEVLLEAKRVAPSQLKSGTVKQFRELTAKQVKANEQIAGLEAELSAVRAKGGTRGARTVEKVRADRQAIFAEIDEILKGGVAHDIGSAAYDAVRFAKAGGRLAISYAQEGIAKLDDIVERVIADFQARGITIDRQQILDEMAEPKAKDELTADQLTKKELQSKVTSLRAQAKRESTAGKAKIQEQIDDLQNQLETGNFRTPTKREIQISKELEDLRAQKALYQGKVQSSLRQLAVPTGKKVAKELSGGIRGLVLGSDIGVLTRQGLFGLSRPVSFAKGVGKGVKAALNEKNLVKIEREILDHDVAGVHAGVAYKKAGLSLTGQTMGHQEELVVGKLLKRIPGIKQLGGSLERFQSAFINTVRSDTFDRAIRLGYNEKELAERAHFINSATGRSNIKNVPTALEVILTSPRYEASRWETLAAPLRNVAILSKDLATGKGLNKGALANLQDMAITAGEVYGLYKLAETSGYEVNFDPTSSDFLKMRKGDEVWDPTAGIAPRMRDVMRLIAWGMEPTYKDNVAKLLASSVTRPISPAIKQPTEITSQQIQRMRGVPEDKLASFFTGWKIDEDEKGLFTLAPLVIQTVKKYLDAGDVPGAVSAGAREFVGQSVSRYPKPKK